MPKLSILDYLNREDEDRKLQAFNAPADQIPTTLDGQEEDYMQEMPTYDTSEEVEGEIDALESTIPRSIAPQQIRQPAAIPQPEMPDDESGMEDVQPEQAKLTDLLQRYKDAQDSRRSGLRNVELLKGGTLIGGAIAGQGRLKPLPTDTFNGLQKLAEEPVNSIQEEIKARPEIQKIYTEENLGDPNSEISELARNIIGQKFPQLQDKIVGMSAKELETLGFKIGNMFTSGGQYQYQMGPPLLQDGKPVATRFRRETGEVEALDPKTGQWMPANGERFFKSDVRENKATGGLVQISPTGGVNELNLPGVSGSPTVKPGQPQRSSDEIYGTLNPAQRDYLTDKVEPVMNKELTDFQGEQEAAKRIKVGLSLGDKLGADMIRAIQNSFARLNGEKGMMSESDVAGFKGRQGILSKVGSFLSMNAEDVISPEDRKFLLAFANEFEKESAKYMGGRAKKHISNIQRNTGLAPNDAAVILNLDSYMPGLSKAALAPDAKKIRVRQKSTGKMKDLDPTKAKKVLEDKDFEEVQ